MWNLITLPGESSILVSFKSAASANRPEGFLRRFYNV